MLGGHCSLQEYMDRLASELRKLDERALNDFSGMIVSAWEHGRNVFVCGNGGSAATGSHLAQDLAKGVIRESDLVSGSMRRMRSISLTANMAWLTALANDLGYEQVFVQQLANYAQAGDLLIAISGSGNSPNIIRAVEWANEHGLDTYGMTGFDGGALKRLQKKGLHVALNDMEMVESIHSCVCHWVVDDVRARIYRQGLYSAGVVSE
ncbi:MAG: SIS domain-containing protein [Thermogutta sp.]